MVSARYKIGVVSLGCDKNRVDTENMLYFLTEAGHQICSVPYECDVLIVNTCGFIEKAREESIDTILEMSEYKSQNCKKLIVTGCLTQKYIKDLFDELLEVDAFLGCNSYAELPRIIEQLFLDEQRVVCFEPSSRSVDGLRYLSTAPHYAYLRVADGCNNSCTYCTIPSIRGAYRSRGIQGLVDEAKKLCEQGARELILVAQDTTAYGQDLEDTGLLRLLDRLSGIDGLEWIRLMYCYPERVTNELITTVSQNPKLAKYMDIPMQHADDDVLKRMRRRTTALDLNNLVDRIRQIDPYIAIRSTFMVGFPGESEQAFSSLAEFIRRHKLDHVGLFAYSRELGTPSYSMDGQLTKSQKKKRLTLLSKIAKDAMLQNNDKYIGRTVRAVYEGIDYDKNAFIARGEFSAPEVDNLIYFKADFVDIGKAYDIKISCKKGLDLVGKL